MDEKNLLKSKTVWIGWGLGLVGGAVTALAEVQQTGHTLPMWLASLVPVLTVTLLPWVRSITTSIAAGGKLAAMLVGLGLALGGYAVTMGLNTPSVGVPTLTPTNDIVEVVAVPEPIPEAILEPAPGEVPPPVSEEAPE